jgi:hypothetical protein
VSGRDFSAWKLDETVFYNPQYEYLATAVQRTNWQNTSASLTRRYGSPLTVCGRSRDFPFTLTEAMRDLRLSGEHDWAFSLLRHYGARDGLYCPSRNWQCCAEGNAQAVPLPDWYRPGDTGVGHLGPNRGIHDWLAIRPHDQCRGLTLKRCWSCGESKARGAKLQRVAVLRH